MLILFLSSSIYANDKDLLKVAYKVSLKGVKSAIEKGANINATTLNGITPLMYASQEGHIKIVEMLINLKADTFSIASYRGHTEIIKLLIDSGAK